MPEVIYLIFFKDQNFLFKDLYLGT